jgi:YVTN family beta-propeller protein
MLFLRNSVLVLVWIIFFVLFLLLVSYLLFEKKQVNLKNQKSINIYAHIHRANIAKKIKTDPYRVYVPNSYDKSVTVIDPVTYKVIDKFTTGKNPQHITPSYNLKTLFVLNDLGNSLTPINPKTGRPGRNIPVYDPYNLYFTPDGRYAIVVAEAGRRLDFRDPVTMKMVKSVPVRCNGINHLDYTVDGRYAVVSCEFSGQLVKLDVAKKKIVGYLNLDSCLKKHSMPQDVRLSADGRLFYIADMMLDGVHLVDANKFRLLGFIATGTGAHSIYPSRDGQLFYVGNRGCHSTTNCKKDGPGSVAVIDVKQRKVVEIWPIPGGGSPDMGNLTPDGKQLWLAGRYDREVYVFDTETGQVVRKIPVGGGPHGLTIWPQPGRYSLGHTGNMR